MFPIPELKMDARRKPSTGYLNRRRDLVTKIYNGAGNYAWRGTAWGALNGYTDWLDHNSTIRNGNKRWIKTFVEDGNNSKRQEAVDTILEMVS